MREQWIAYRSSIQEAEVPCQAMGSQRNSLVNLAYYSANFKNGLLLFMDKAKSIIA